MYFSPDLLLYGKPGKPSTILVLRPGDAVRIVGSVPAHPVKPNAERDESASREQTPLEGKLYAYFSMHTEEVRRSKRSECQGYESLSTGTLSLRSENAITVTISNAP